MDEKPSCLPASPAALAHLQKLAELGLLTSAVLHEIKQPLAAIKGYAQLARETSEPPFADHMSQLLAQVERIERILANHRRMLQGGGPRSRFDLCSAAASATRLLEPRAREVGANVELRLPTSPVFAEALEGQIVQILVNLVANALDAVAGCAQRTVEVSVAAGPQGPEVQVSDSGTGISPAVAGRLFAPFFTTKGQEAGTGLGLYISRVLAEGNGASLELARPAEVPAALRTGFRLRFGAKAGEKPLRGAVLVVDDEEVVCSMLKTLLEPDGLEVCSALSADEALELMDQRRFDLVLCDKNLPGMGGLDLARAVRARLPSCPVIMMTGYPSLETAQEGLEIGLLDYLEKPFDDITEVRERVREALGSATAPAPKPHTRRVLVIEDRRDEAVRFGEAVTLAGGVPAIAATLEEGLSQLATHGADGVILSLDLRKAAPSPEALRTLRARAGGVLVAVADHPSLEQTVAAIRMGATACLPRSLATAEAIGRELSRLLEKAA
jgi:DNA-binding response OmpR family regulator